MLLYLLWLQNEYANDSFLFPTLNGGLKVKA